MVRITRGDGIKRLVMSTIYNWLFRLLFSLDARDINGTPKLMWRSRFTELELTSKDWFIDAELMIGATQRGFRMAEVQVHFAARDHGASNVRLSTLLEFVKNMLHYRFGAGRTER